MAFIADLYHDEIRSGYLVASDIKKVLNVICATKAIVGKYTVYFGKVAIQKFYDVVKFPA